MKTIWGMVLAGILLAWSPAAQAAPGRGFTISPAFQEIDIKADQPRAQYSLTLSNQAGADQNFRLSVVDFGSLDEQGGVAFLGQPADELEHRYGLASWMTLEKTAVFVPAGSKIELAVTVDNRASLAAGGHYGAVLATAVTDTGEPAVDPRVGVKQVLSSLVLVTKDGGVEHQLKLVSQVHNGSHWRLPSSIEHRFQNTGNVHLVPRGVTEVKSPTGKVVLRGALNEQSGEILPESFRRYKTPLTKLTAAWMPGRYKVVTTYRYDGTDTTHSLTTGFWYMGTALVWLVLVLALVAAGFLAWWLWLRPKRRRS